MKMFYMSGGIGGNYAFRKFDNLSEADEWAKNMAKDSPGDTFFVLKPVMAWRVEAPEPTKVDINEAE